MSKSNILILLSLVCCLATLVVVILDWGKDKYAHIGLGITGLAVIFGAAFVLMERKNKEKSK